MSEDILSRFRQVRPKFRLSNVAQFSETLDGRIVCRVSDHKMGILSLAYAVLVPGMLHIPFGIKNIVHIVLALLLLLPLALYFRRSPSAAKCFEMDPALGQISAGENGTVCIDEIRLFVTYIHSGFISRDNSLYAVLADGSTCVLLDKPQLGLFTREASVLGYMCGRPAVLVEELKGCFGKRPAKYAPEKGKLLDTDALINAAEKILYAPDDETPKWARSSTRKLDVPEDVLSRFRQVSRVLGQPFSGILLREEAGGQLICRSGRARRLIGLPVYAGLIYMAYLAIHDPEIPKLLLYLSYVGCVAMPLAIIISFKERLSIRRFFDVDTATRRITVYVDASDPLQNEMVDMDDVRLLVAHHFGDNKDGESSLYAVSSDGTAHMLMYGLDEVSSDWLHGPAKVLGYMCGSPAIWIMEWSSLLGKGKPKYQAETGEKVDVDELIRAAKTVLYDPKAAETPKWVR